MFDIGSWELIVILIIGLLVIGPDKLPGIARQIGVWVGRARAYISSVKGDIDREMRLQELQDMMKQNDMHDIVEETKSSLTVSDIDLNKPFDPDKTLNSDKDNKLNNDVTITKHEKDSLESR